MVQIRDMEASKIFKFVITKNFRELEKNGGNIDMNIPLNLKGTTALHIAAGFHDKSDALKICNILLQFGADVDKADCFGVTALHIAAQNGNTHILDYLIRNGGSVLKCDNNGHSLHYYAYKNNKFATLKRLSKIMNTDQLHEEVVIKKFSFYPRKVETIKIPVANKMQTNNDSFQEKYCTCGSHNSSQVPFQSKDDRSAFVSNGRSNPTVSGLNRGICAAQKTYSLFSTITYMSEQINSRIISCNSVQTKETTTLNSSDEGNEAFLSEDSQMFPSINSEHQTTLNDQGNSDAFVTVVEEFLYQDMKSDIRLIERRCPGISSFRNCLTNVDLTTSMVLRPHADSTDENYFSFEQDSINSLASSIFYLNENGLKSQLASLGFSAGPLTPATIHTLHRHLLRLKRTPNKVINQVADKKYTRELIEMLKNIEEVDWQSGEMLQSEMSEPFANQDLNHVWRCGISKICFDYILLDPRITVGLDLGRPLTPTERFNYFISSIFYIGKGTSARPYFHLHEAASMNSHKKSSEKTNTIRDIWETGYGVVSLHVFQNSIPAEAWTREAAMIIALGIENLTNVKEGSFYGSTSTWKKSKKKLLGSFLLYKAFNILIFEGERQIRPENLQRFQK